MITVAALLACGFPFRLCGDTPTLTYIATFHGSFDTFNANAPPNCPSLSSDPSQNPCITGGSLDFTVDLTWLPTEGGEQFTDNHSIPLFEIDPLGLRFGDVEFTTVDPSAPYVQINSNGTTNGQDFNGGLPVLPVSAFVQSILGANASPYFAVKFSFSTTGPFDSPTSMSFTMGGGSDAAETSDLLSWSLNLTGSATPAPPTPEPGTIFLAALVLPVLVACMGGRVAAGFGSHRRFRGSARL